MNELFAVVTITILAVISPGADFAMVSRNSYLYGRISGLLSSLGISLGVQFHVLYTIVGVGVLIIHSPSLFSVMKFIGAGYLVYVGITTILTPLQKNQHEGTQANLSYWQSFRMGFLTNAFNPKTMLFVISIFTQFVSPSTPLAVVIGYGLFMSLAHLVWFCIVATFFSIPQLRKFLLDRQKSVNSVIGTALMFLGISLAIVSAT